MNSIIMVNDINMVTIHPLFLDLENVFRYGKPGIPVLIEYPFELKLQLLVLTLCEIPNLLIFIPKPYTILTLLLNLIDIVISLK